MSLQSKAQSKPSNMFSVTVSIRVLDATLGFTITEKSRTDAPSQHRNLNYERLAE